MKKQKGQTGEFQLSMLFYPLFPFLGLFFGVSLSRFVESNPFLGVIVITAFVSMGFLANFYFFKCLKANAFHLKNSSVVSVYILYALVILFIFKTFFVQNLILSFVAGIFIRRRKELFEGSSTSIGEGLKISVLTLPVSFVSYVIYRSPLLERFAVFQNHICEGLFLSSMDWFVTATVLSALLSLTAALTISGFLFFNGKERVD